MLRKHGKNAPVDYPRKHTSAMHMKEKKKSNPSKGD